MTDLTADAQLVKTHFAGLCAYLRIPFDQSEWDDIFAAHTEAHRHYHNFKHLADMLRLVDGLKFDENSLNRLRAFIIYHDFVYSTDAENYASNEVASATRAARFLNSAGAKTSFTDFVYDTILASKTHKADAKHGFAAQFALDCDMAILGSSRATYDAYRGNIRAEFTKMAPDTHAFNLLRAEVFLIPTLKTARIFETVAMHGWYEKRARENLRRELGDIMHRYPDKVPATLVAAL